MKGLSGKSVVVTGGSRGIGLACVQRLLEEGCRVLFTGRNEKNGNEALRKLRKTNEDVEFLAGNMAEESFCTETVKRAISLYGSIDFIVNNAFPFTSMGVNATRHDWIKTMEAGPLAYATMISEFVRQRGMVKPGAIVLMSSISAHIAQPNRWTYNAAKGAVVQLNRCAAMDLAPMIRVNTVSPGWVWTDEVKKATKGEALEKWDKVWGKYHMLRRLAEPHEIASIVAFLLSDDASFITGADIDASGGYLAMGSEGLGETSNFAGSE